MDLIRKGNSRSCILEKKEEVEYITFQKIKDTGFVSHGFSTRIGGVSEDFLGEMNLGYNRGDRKENVDENFRRMGNALGFATQSMVLSDQTHKTQVRKVTGKDCGKGFCRDRDYHDMDGLITNEPQIVLATFFADCVPLFFADPIQQAIGLAHSGWRGTVGKMGRVVIEEMKKEFGSRPENIIAAIGPSICGDCYEVSEDVVEEFQKAFTKEQCNKIATRKTGGKYNLDLWKCNEIILEEAGIQKQNMETTDLCTCCNPEFLFSHRASHGKRGNMGAFMWIHA